MSEPTYRIEIEHNPGDTFPFAAHVRRLSDGEACTVKVGLTPHDATANACAWIAAQAAQRPATTLYADETGVLCEPPATPEPQSLRA